MEYLEKYIEIYLENGTLMVRCKGVDMDEIQAAKTAFNELGGSDNDDEAGLIKRILIEYKPKYNAFSKGPQPPNPT